MKAFIIILIIIIAIIIGYGILNVLAEKQNNKTKDENY